MSHTQLLDAIIQKKKEKKSVVVHKKKPTVAPKRRMEQSVFKMIVEMAYEMKYANRYCEAERSNRFTEVPTYWNQKHHKGSLPFEIEYKNYENLRLGDIVITPHFPRNAPNWCHSRIAMVVRLNKKSISLADCDQDGRLIAYNPDEDADYPTKEARKDYNKLFPRFRVNRVPVITGTKHLRYDGWDC
jgi:hypothetical protein